MTRSLAKDPSRSCLKREAWPETDRRLWLTAITPGDLLDGGGERADFRPASNRKIEVGYGRYLGWLQYTGNLDPSEAPAARITKDRVAAYIDFLGTVNRRITLLARLQELHAAALVMGPGLDWGWIKRIESRVRARPSDARDKRHRIVDARDLLDLGVQLMAQSRTGTKRQRATLFRDGLLIALLSCRPLRRANITDLEIGRHVMRRGDQWWIMIEGDATKNWDPIDMPWPLDLVAALEAWLKLHRPFLVAARGRWHSPAGDALWVSTDGSPLTQMALYDRVVEHTTNAFGHPINPHLFRDCAATTIAIEDPEHIQSAAALLGHRSLATTQQYYNQANALDAARRMQEAILNLRQETK